MGHLFGLHGLAQPSKICKWVVLAWHVGPLAQPIGHLYFSVVTSDIVVSMEENKDYGKAVLILQEILLFPTNIHRPNKYLSTDNSDI